MFTARYPIILLALPILLVLATLLVWPLQAEEVAYDIDGVTYHRPATLKASELRGFEKLPEGRQKIITTALDTVSRNTWLRYKFGGSEPSAGGFDCSGAMYYVLRRAGYKPPRTSAQQYLWVRDAMKLTEVKGYPASLGDDVFKHLRPGDLVFWSGTYVPTDDRKVKITHISLYLGQEKDGRQVMVGATKGRSYRGKKGDGYGVYDFHLPAKGSRSRFVGYGPPPGLEGE